MILLISLAVSAVFAVFAGQQLRKRPAPFYVGAVMIAAASVFVVWSGMRLPTWIADWMIPIFARGGLPGGLFIIVMWTGAFPNGSKPVKYLFPIRRQLSIIASILTLGHNVAYGKTYFVRLLVSPASLSATTLAAAVCSLVMLLIMLPLFVTSFLSVRKKMRPKAWKRLQRSAYVFYGLLYCHILLLTLPNALAGKPAYLLTAFVYTSIFSSYAVCRIMKALTKKRNSARLAQRQICAVGSCLVLAVMILVALLLWNTRHPLNETAGTEAGDLPNILPEEPNVPSEDSGILHDGVYTGSGMGMNAKITVEVTISDGEISAITVLSSREDEPYYSDALAVIDDILSANSVEVDTVSGATYSSGGIIDAVEDALREAAKP